MTKNFQTDIKNPNLKYQILYFFIIFYEDVNFKSKDLFTRRNYWINLKKVSIQQKYKCLSGKRKVVGYEDELEIDFGIAITHTMERVDKLIEERNQEGEKIEKRGE